MQKPIQRALDALIDKVLVDTYDEVEEFIAFSVAFQDTLTLPAEAFVLGEPVTVVDVHYDGNPRRGVTATCQRGQRAPQAVAACDVAFPVGSEAAVLVAAYRRWLNLPPLAAPATSPKPPASSTDDLDLSAPVELVLLSVGQSAARCRVLRTDRQLTLRSGGLWRAVPGELLTVAGKKQWTYGNHRYLSGAITGRRLDVAALGLVPLRLLDEHPWDPSEAPWGDPGVPLDPGARSIIERGPRRSFEMERILPAANPLGLNDDPILEACERHDSGDTDGGRKILMNLLASDLRCLDAHAHLGDFAFDSPGDEALRHYEVGVRIGELSLGDDFQGVLPWGRIDNRPFLRCLRGYGLALWRAGRADEAHGVFERMLWLNPMDNQGVRILLDDLDAGRPWREG